MPILREVAECGDIIRALIKVSDIHPGNASQLFKDDTQAPGEFTNRRSLSEYRERVTQVALGLIAQGLEEGSHVCVLSENRPDWNIFDHAVLMNHCTTVGVYTNDSVDIIKFKLNDTGAAAILVEDKKQLDKVLSIPTDEIPAVKKIFLFQPCEGGDGDKRVVLFDELPTAGARAGAEDRAELEKRTAAIKETDVSRLVYTSGTSGAPKGVMLTHRCFMSNVVASMQDADIRDDDILISYMPEAHVFQAIFSLGILLVGACQAYSFRKTLVPDLAQVRPTIFPGVQRVWAKVHSGIDMQTRSGVKGFLRKVAPRFLAKVIKKKAGIDRVRRFYSGASKLESFTFEFFKGFFGDEILLGYGISETIIVTMNSVKNHRFGSSGRPVPGMAVKIIDIPGPQGREIPTGETGEIAVRGPSVFTGYLNNDEKYSEVVDPGGWYHTGDRGFVDEDGYLTVLGRSGFRVKFGDGEFHDLEVIGARILAHAEYISQIAVYGEGKDYPVAVISLTDEEDDLRKIAAVLGVEYTSRNEFAYHEKVVAAVRADFERAAAAAREKDRVPPGEDVKKALYIRPMSEDNNEKTPTAKTRLNFILSRYEKHILDLYKSSDNFVVLEVE